MSITVYDSFGKEQGTYDKNSRTLALFDGGFTGELFEYNNTRIGVVEYGGRLKLDSTIINASSSGGSNFGDTFANLGAFAIVGVLMVGPLLAGSALTSALLNRNKRETIKWMLICSCGLLAFWLPYKSGLAVFSVFYLGVIAYACIGVSLALRKYSVSKVKDQNWLIKYIVGGPLVAIEMIVVLIIAELILGLVPIYLAHPSWIEEFLTDFLLFLNNPNLTSSPPSWVEPFISKILSLIRQLP